MCPANVHQTDEYQINEMGLEMNNKNKVASTFGGESAEHDISILSANNIIEAMDKKKYEIYLIGITGGRWYGGESAKEILESAKKRYAVQKMICWPLCQAGPVKT